MTSGQRDSHPAYGGAYPRDAQGGVRLLSPGPLVETRRSEGPPFFLGDLMAHSGHGQWHTGVPTSGVLLSIHWCHACSAWTVLSSASTFDGETSRIIVPLDSSEFGPFDEVITVLDYAEKALNSLLLTPGRPWDQGSWG